MVDYYGKYVTFHTQSKKDAAVLLGADNIIGDVYTIELRDVNKLSLACLINRFNQVVGYLDSETTRHIRVMQANEWYVQAILSLVAFTDTPEPGHYWGEVILTGFPPTFKETAQTYISNLSNTLRNGKRPEVDLGKQAREDLFSSQGNWVSEKTVPFPAKDSSTAFLKTHEKFSEKLIEQGRKGNKGCYFISWLFLLAIVAILIFTLKSCVFI